MAVLKASSTIVATSSPQEGYHVGGAAPAASDTIRRFPFSASPFSATDVGELVAVSNNDRAGMQDVSYGYYASNIASPLYDRIERFPFGAPPVTATDIGELSQGRYYGAGHSSSTKGYISGGDTLPASPPGVETIDEFPFAAPPVTGTDIGELNTGGMLGHSGHQSETAAFTSGGSPTPSSEIRTFPFSTPFVTASIHGSLTGTTYGSGYSSIPENKGYSAGGAAPTISDHIDSFPFSNAPVTHTDIGELLSVTQQAAGMSSPGSGFTSGGYRGTPAVATDAVHKFPFSSPSVTVTDVGELDVATVNGAGISATVDTYVNILLDTDTVPATYFSISGTPGTNQYVAAGGTGLEYYPSDGVTTPGGFGIQEGFTGGGWYPAPYLDTVDKFPFSASFSTATDVGELDAAKANLASQSSSTDAYATGGVIPTTLGLDVIAKFPFTSSPFTATDVGELTQGRHSAVGAASQTEGYTSGGSFSPPNSFYNTIDKFSFGAPPITATDVAELIQHRRLAAGQSSDTEGFISGGASDLAPKVNHIYKFPFAAPPVTSSFHGSITQSRADVTGQSSDTTGFSSGGTTPTTVDTIDSFPFSSPPVSSTDAGELSEGRYGSAGQSSATEGFTSGGVAPTPWVTIDKFPFSSPFTTATDAGDLSQQRAGNASSNWY